MIFAEDTRPETREVLLRLWRMKSPEERLTHGFRISNSVKRRVMESVASQMPGISPVEILVETFRRTYRLDFSTEDLLLVCERIRQYHSKKLT